MGPLGVYCACATLGLGQPQSPRAPLAQKRALPAVRSVAAIVLSTSAARAFRQLGISPPKPSLLDQLGADMAKVS